MQEVKVIGSLEAKFESTNRIYDVGGGSSPTLSTMQGGNQEPKILEEQIPCKLNKMPEGHLDSLDNAKICDIDTPTASTVTARYYKGIGAHKDNMCIVAMRGRNPNNPSDRTTGSPTEQRLEANTQGTSNCLTSVRKDNMVLVKQATKQGYAECELGGVADLSFPDSVTRRGRVQERGSVCHTIMAQNQELCRIETQYRIRKLTPRECGRLMGVSNEDIDKMAEVNSNTQLYKQFGNSIVVDVMCAMFRNLNIKNRD